MCLKLPILPKNKSTYFFLTLKYFSIYLVDNFSKIIITMDMHSL